MNPVERLWSNLAQRIKALKFERWEVRPPANDVTSATLGVQPITWMFVSGATVGAAFVSLTMLHERSWHAQADEAPSDGALPAAMTTAQSKKTRLLQDDAQFP